jgi:serine protease
MSRILGTHAVRRLVAGATVALVAATGLAAPVGAAPVGSSVVPTPVPASGADSRATDQIIVKYAEGAAPVTADVSREAGEKVGLKGRTSDGSVVVKLPGKRSGASVSATSRRIAALPGVEYAEPDTILYPTAVPTDPRYGEQWDLSAPAVPAAGSTLVGATHQPAWDTTTGTSDVVVAVLDTGITAHADLVGQTVPGYDFINTTAFANDGNARDADPSDPGDWITATENASGTFAGCGVDDSSWHGTHVAGTIAAATNNGIGVAGIAPGSKILPVRVLGKCGGYTSDIVDGMRWSAGLAVAGVPTNPNPAAVLNLSLGGSGACSTTQQQAINDVTAVGATVVVAAGNSNINASNAQPANCAGVVTVAATGSTGSRAYYSNYGSLVEISAPGGDSQLTPGTVLSTLNAGLTSPGADNYVGYQGTSMATPHVAGVAALVKSVRPSASPATVMSLLQATAAQVPLGSTCTTALCGRGMMDAAAAVASAASTGPRTLGAFSKTVPAPGATAVSGPSTTLQWTASSGATGYEVCVVTGLTTPCTTWTSAGSAASATVSGLTSATLYSWQVRAVSGATSAEANVSLRSTFTTGTFVSAPGALSKTSPANAATGQALSLTLSWAASTGATSYEYCMDATVNSVCDGTWTSTGTTRTASRTGLAYSTRYEWQVRARNTAGVTNANAGSWWTFTTVALPLPGAFNKTSPSNNATGRTTTLTLSWAASTNVVRYEVCFDKVNNGICDGVWTSVGTARSATASALTARTAYYWQVRSVNATGTTNANAGTWWKFTTR